jgi:galactokinase
MPGFLARFGALPDTFASALGRVNLMGEHTDTSEGYVLPIAIPRQTRVELALRTDGVVRVASNAFVGDESFELGREAKRGNWIDYVQGTVQALVRAVPAMVPALRGFDALVSSDLPLGAGLASSAALEVALIRALCAAVGVALDPVAMARIGRAAENDFVGMPSGIMDQMAATLATESAALFLDTRSLAYEHVALPAALELLVIDSGVTHAHAGGEYATRRDEVARAAYVLELTTLRDASDGDPRTTSAAIAMLSPPLDRRARHVVSENHRVLDTVVALRAADEDALARLFRASHDSLRDDFAVTVPEVDRLVAIAQADPGVIAARMTGGGFGGAIVALARRGEASAAGARICASYGASSGVQGAVVVP